MFLWSSSILTDSVKLLSARLSRFSLLCAPEKQKAILVTLSKLISFCLCVNSRKNCCHFSYSEDLDALTSVFSLLPLLSPFLSSLVSFFYAVLPQKSVKEGILLKQTSSFQRWKRRYFKLRGRTLYYAKDCKVQECVKLLTDGIKSHIWCEILLKLLPSV